jgi:hypothetical protein
MMRTVFIAGLHRSGTTLLNFLIGTDPRCVALGETWGVLRDPGRDHGTCSCGARVSQCTFWGPLLPQLNGSYQPVLERAAEYGSVAVDSSKRVEALQLLPADTKVVHCIRDVRGWTLSRGSGALQWYFRNRRIMRDLANHNTMIVSYDELALRPQYILDKLGEFLDLELSTRYPGANHHVINGNWKMKHGEQFGAIAYDYRWFLRGNPVAMLPPVRTFNRRFVYGNLS